ncbi:fatty acyl-AMP ligase [Actinoplanes sp. NPDC000266]
MQDATDLVEMLRRHADQRGNRIAVRLAGGGGLTYAQVDRRARAVAAKLRESTSAGDRVGLLFPPGPDFLPALFGCWYAGVVAVPLASPDAAAPAVTLTPGDVIGEVDEHESARHEVAVVQHTSGSTGTPKAVLVSHRNYTANMRMLTEFTRSIAPDVYDFRTVSWLPHFHDMGLALLLFTVWHGGTTTLIPPMAFLRDPGLWLRTIDETRGNLTAAPNFAFDLCVRRVSAPDAAELDLSSMAIMLNGAEPVRAGTLRRFTTHFASAGFRPESFAPAYGLAEGTVFVSGLRKGGPPRTVAFDRRSLQDGVARAGDGQTLVSCGGRPEGLTVRIVDPTLHTECAPGRIGEIWVHGPSIGLGYQGHDAFDARLAGPDYRPYLRTGDLGFLWEGELFVVGRYADLIILNGRLLPPEDLEYTIERSHRALEGRRCAVFAIGEDENRLAAAVEVRPDQPVDEARRRDIETAIRTAVALEHDVELTEVLIVATGTLPVTTSGKARRAKCRELLLAGALPTL